MEKGDEDEMPEIRILKSDELPFAVSEDVARSIDGYVEAVITDNPLAEILECDVFQASRCLPEEQERWVQEYYVGRKYLSDPDGTDLKTNEGLKPRSF